MLAKKDLLILSNLRSNARVTLTNISKKTSIPISTVYDKLKSYEGSLIKKHTTLLDFAALGFAVKANIALKVDKRKKEEVKEYLIKHHSVNSVYKINNDFDFLVEGVFRNIKEVEEFIEKLEERFRIMKKLVYYIIEEIKRECFMEDPAVLELVL